MSKINSASIITIVFLLGILVMVNTIGIRYFLRADLTSSQIYSLSKASKDIVANIQDKLLVKAYFSPNLPGIYGGVERYLRDMLEDYRAYSRGHLVYEFIDPGSEQELEKEAQSFSIPPRQLQAVANDKVELIKAYLGVVFIYGDKRETIPVITSTENLEYEITSLIHRLTNPNQPILGIASTGKEDQRASMQKFYEAIGRIYDVRPVNLDVPVDDAFDGVFVIAPRQPFTDWQLFNLDQYIIKGGKVGMLMNSYQAGIQNVQNRMPATSYNLNINKFLNNYGLGLGEDMLIDARANMVQMQTQQGFMVINQPVRFYYLPIITTFNPENIITRDLQNFQLFFPSSVDTTLAKQKGFEVEGLMYTSEYSGRRTGSNIYMDPTQQMTPADFSEKGIPVAAIVKGKFTSYFAESGPPKKPANPGDEEGKEEDYTGPFVKEAEGENRLILVGDGNIVLDDYVQDPRELMFVQNAADWLLQAEDLISIRSKQIPVKPLKYNIISEDKRMLRNLIKWANRIGPVLLVIVFGIALWQVRRIRNKALMVG